MYDVVVSLEYLKDHRRPGLKQSAAGHGVKTSVYFEICTEAFARSLGRSRSAVCPHELDRFVAEKEQAINRDVFWADKRIEVFVEFRGTRSALPRCTGCIVDGRTSRDFTNLAVPVAGRRRRASKVHMMESTDLLSGDRVGGLTRCIRLKSYGVLPNRVLAPGGC